MTAENGKDLLVRRAIQEANYNEAFKEFAGEGEGNKWVFLLTGWDRINRRSQKLGDSFSEGDKLYKEKLWEFLEWELGPWVVVTLDLYRVTTEKRFQQFDANRIPDVFRDSFGQPE